MRHLTLCLCLLAGSAQAQFSINGGEFTLTAESTTSPRATETVTFGPLGDSDSAMHTLGSVDPVGRSASARADVFYQLGAIDGTHDGIGSFTLGSTLRLGDFPFTTGVYAASDSYADFQFNQPVRIEAWPPVADVYSVNGESLELYSPPFSTDVLARDVYLPAGTHRFAWADSRAEIGDSIAAVTFIVHSVPEPSSVVLLLVASFLCRSVFRAC